MINPEMATCARGTEAFASATTTLLPASREAIKLLGMRINISGSTLPQLAEVLGTTCEISLPPINEVTEKVQQALDKKAAIIYRKEMVEGNLLNNIFPDDVDTIRADLVDQAVVPSHIFCRRFPKTAQSAAEDHYQTLRAEVKAMASNLLADQSDEPPTSASLNIDTEMMTALIEEKIQTLAQDITATAALAVAELQPQRSFITRKIKSWEGVNDNSYQNVNRAVLGLTRQLMALNDNAKDFIVGSIIDELDLPLAEATVEEAYNVARQVISQAIVTFQERLENIRFEEESPHPAITRAGYIAITAGMDNPDIPVMDRNNELPPSRLKIIGDFECSVPWLPPASKRQLIRYTAPTGQSILYIDGSSPESVSITKSITDKNPVEGEVFDELIERVLKIALNGNVQTAAKLKKVSHTHASKARDYAAINMFYYGRSAPNAQRIYATQMNAQELFAQPNPDQTHSLGSEEAARVIVILGQCNKKTQIAMLRHLLGKSRAHLKNKNVGSI